MIYNVIVKKINPDIEEEILINVSGLELTCFVTYWLPNIEIGKCYKANIDISILDNLDIVEQNYISNKNFSQIENTFAYIICGKFNFDTRIVEAGLQIKLDEDSLDIYDFAYLNGKYIKFKVDRITLAFLTE